MTEASAHTGFILVNYVRWDFYTLSNVHVLSAVTVLYQIVLLLLTARSRPWTQEWDFKAFWEYPTSGKSDRNENCYFLLLNLKSCWDWSLELLAEASADHIQCSSLRQSNLSLTPCRRAALTCVFSPTFTDLQIIVSVLFSVSLPFSWLSLFFFFSNQHLAFWYRFGPPVNLIKMKEPLYASWQNLAYVLSCSDPSVAN